jgi:purine-binding chemotaxis protein CheW
MSNATSWYQPTVAAEPTIELVILDIRDVSFGLPIAKIDRIVNNSISDPHSLLAGSEILDLHQQLFGLKCLAPAAYVMVRRDRQEMCSIPVDNMPTLTNVPIDRICTLPAELRETSPIGIASHVAIISTTTGDLTVFILEI